MNNPKNQGTYRVPYSENGGVELAQLAITENLIPRANYHDTVWLFQANRKDDSLKVMAAGVIQRALGLCWSNRY